MLNKIIERIKKLFAKSKYLDIKSKKVLHQIRIVMKDLERDSYGEIKWHYQMLEDSGLTDPKLLSDEYILIDQKKSTLKKRERDLVTGIVGMAVVKCIEK